MKTSELIGLDLDWAVHKARGYTSMIDEKYGPMYFTPSVPPGVIVWTAYPPRCSTDWALGGPIIEEEEIGITRNAPCSQGRQWEAHGSITACGAGYSSWGYGLTPLIAAMRCFVASRLGDDVDVPEKLIGGEPS